jgi:hypothetical protein
MVRRADIDENPFGLSPGVLQPDPPVVPVADADVQSGWLGQDHPRWPSDAVALSKAARELVAKLRPVVIAVRSFWDHRLRYVAIGGLRIGVDAGGSYRIEM